MTYPPIAFPAGKRFAFTIFDDTDVSTLPSIRPIYELLFKLGLLTTKTVWSLDYDGPSAFCGSASLQDREYSEYMRTLQQRGFEIAFHGATMETAVREDTARALDLFRELFGSGPTSYAAHAHNRDNLYWGCHRFSFRLWQALYRLISGRADPDFAGHVPGSDVYWADLAHELRYVRSFTYAGIDLTRVTRAIPYSTARSPGVKAWFPSCDADNVEEFVALLSAENQAALEANGGICILSTHFGKGFVRGGEVRPDVVRVLEALSKRCGWFVPVTPLLDHLAARHGVAELSPWALFRLEGLWFIHSILRRRTKRQYEATEVPFLLEAQRAARERKNLSA